MLFCLLWQRHREGEVYLFYNLDVFDARKPYRDGDTTSGMLEVKATTRTRWMLGIASD
jgi:hypothetical protein